MGQDSNVDYNAIADRVYIEAWALALIFGAVDQALAGGWRPAGLCAVLSAFLQFPVIRWSAWLKAHPDNQLIVSLHAITKDARWWIVTLAFFLLLIFLSPFVEQQRWPFASRAATPSVTGPIGALSPPLPAPTASAQPAQLPSTPTSVHQLLSTDEIQFRTDLRKFALGPFEQATSSSIKAAYLTMQRISPNDSQPANILLRRLIQSSISAKFEAFEPSLRKVEIDNMDARDVQNKIFDALGAYSELQDYFLAYCKITNVCLDEDLGKQWMGDDARMLSDFQGLQTYPETDRSLKQVQPSWFITNNHKFDQLIKSK